VNRPAAPSVPATLDDVTAPWLAAALSRAAPGTMVERVEPSTILHGSLTKVRLEVSFKQNPHGLPTSQVLKAAFEDHGLPVSMRSEAIFYDVARPRIDVTAPGCLASVYDDQQGAVVLEDLDALGCSMTDPRVPWSVDLVADGLRQLASLHAGWWGEGRVPGIPDFEGSNALGAVLMAPGFWEACLDGPTGVHVPPAYRDRERIGPMVQELWRLDERRPRAFCHGDAHLGNTFIDAAGGAGFLDWGGVRAGHWAREVCYFLTGALSIEDRRTYEQMLLKQYLASLLAYGADPVPTWEGAWRTYRRHCLHGLLWFLCPTQMQSIDTINANVERFGTAVTDHAVATLF
jgi:hypothetical protein